jgi:aryl-alcohol dehydrogenase-like predicted oxidoreductase
MPLSLSSIETQMDEMADLVDAEVIRAVGVSNFKQDQMIEAHDALAEHGIPLAANQVHFSLVKRGIEFNGILESAKELGITVMAYTPLGQGLLTGKIHNNPELLDAMPRMKRNRLRGNLKKTQKLIDLLESIADEHKATVAQITLNWTTTYHGDTIIAIPGASKAYQAEQNAEAMRISLSSEQKEAISSLSLEIR